MRTFNFSAGPATLPIEVLQQAAEEMCDWHGCGMGVMEMSHRGREFESIHAEAMRDLRALLTVPDHYQILFLQGGAIAENAIIPMNLLGNGGSADYVLTGSWSVKSLNEAARYAPTRVVAGDKAGPFKSIPAFQTWDVSERAAYLHLCTNETIHGVEYFDLPGADITRGVPLVADVSSHFLSRPMPLEPFGVMYGGAQKNAGIAGLTFVIVRRDLLDRALPICPSAFQWQTVAANDSMYNTPPTYAIYIAGLVFKWLQRQGGLAGIEQRNLDKADLLYRAIDASAFFRNDIDRGARSRMNVPFLLAEPTLNDAFLAGANERGLKSLKGHKSVGGMRASIYNAMPLEGVQALVDYMRSFEKERA